MSIQHWLNIIEIFIYLWPSRHVIYMWYGYCMLLSNWKSKSYQIMSQAFFGMIWDGLACLSTIVMICDDPLYPHISPWYPHMSPWYPHDIPMISPWYPHDIPVVPPFNHSCCLSLSHHFCWLNHHIGGLFIIGFTTCARVKTWYMSIYSL